ncbi:MAG: prepilin-type N-terminal cleavage/methylation domain-containing protein [Dissulfurispiraceae bacterium]
MRQVKVKVALGVSHPQPQPLPASLSGFTLIEVIITIVVAAVLATMLYSYFNTAITQSSTPATRMVTALQSQTVMENITADWMASSQNTSYLTSLSINIGPEGSSNGTANYGQYKVIDNHFITWNSSNNDVKTGASNCLKVSVQDSLGETLTEIYAAQNIGSTNCN